MNVTVSVEKSLSQLLYDLGFKHLCDGNHSYPVNNLDSKIIERHLIKKQTLNFPIYVNRSSKGGRNFLTNPGVFIPPSMYYFFKEARYYPDKKTFAVMVNVVKGVEKEVNPGKGCEKEMMVEEIRTSITDLSKGIFERFYRAIDSVSEAYTICR